MTYRAAPMRLGASHTEPRPDAAGLGVAHLEIEGIVDKIDEALEKLEQDLRTLRVLRAADSAARLEARPYATRRAA